MKIRPKIVSRYLRKAGAFGPGRNLFEGYEVVEVRDTKIGKSITIKGPKKEFTLYQTAKGLTIIAPPANEGENAIQQTVPLFFVSPMKSSGKIQGAEYFALINDELVAYRSVGGGLVEEL